jgi:hypothetical protein
MNQDRQEMQQGARVIWLPLSCPLCKHRFAWQQLRRTGGACPHCTTPIGVPFYYRAILCIVYLFAAAGVMYKGYQLFGPNWLWLGWPFALVAGLFVQSVTLRAFPPRLEAHADGNTWLKLS